MAAIPPALAQQQAPPAISERTSARILILNSYHKGYSWSDAIVLGIEQTLRSVRPDIEIWTEYMDTKRYPDESHRSSLGALYRQKFSNKRFDAVITSDNNALTFTLPRREELFGKTPIVFCGINRFVPGMIADHEAITGVTEEADLIGSVRIARMLLPRASKVIVNASTSATGRALLTRFRELEAQFGEQLAFEYWIDVIVEDTIAKAQSVGPDTIFFSFDTGRTREGDIITGDEKIRRIASALPFPVFTVTDMGLGKGAIGGRVESGYAQGQTAARMALDILGGTPAGDIPVMTKSPNRDMFDYAVLARFGISLDRLPEGSVIINQPVPAYNRYRTFVLVSMAVVFVLGIFITIMIFNIGRRRWAEEALKESESRLRALIEHSPAAIYVKDLEGRYIIANDEYRRRYGLEPPDVIGKRAEDFLVPEMADHVSKFDALVYSTRETHTDEITGYYADGSVHTHKLVKFPLFDSRGDLNGLGCVSTDITDVKDAHEAAQRLQAEIAHVSRLSTMGEMAAGFAHELNQP
ncbi:MAG: PAS domain-containing protein, partial [Rhodospirillales bacterium]|nr:PAS domain-containing protein [Rhodospirillales bacterium]